MRKSLVAAAAATCAVLLGVIVVRQAGPLFRHPIVAMRLIAADPPTRLPVPVVGVWAGDLRDSWGAPRSGGRRHEGIDIFAPRGRVVASTTPGIVVTVGQRRLGGNVVRVLGPGGQWHYYAHLSAFGPIHEGDVIAQGAILGYVGDTGNAKGTPCHLHYGVYRFRGGAINPYEMLTHVR